ncbi:phage tail protein [Archangium violaceum]|uniref:phage tail protein n=1 Tax=Archangium violaceum TaxID=83451 RepID=UPI00195219BB|nr:phage tail protein [Archangium violaceum]QRN93098.1 phage tail protein [Archangium violaceum]
MSQPIDPLFTFQFELAFQDEPLSGSEGTEASSLAGAFSECSGLEATMEPKVIKAGGYNYGAYQRVGPVTFATVVLKRGISRDGRLFHWFQRVATGDFGHRRSVQIHLKRWVNAGSREQPEMKQEIVLTWKLDRALPIKFKAADFNARGTEVGIEELHLAHEGLTLDTKAG